MDVLGILDRIKELQADGLHMSVDSSIWSDAFLGCFERLLDPIASMFCVIVATSNINPCLGDKMLKELQQTLFKCPKLSDIDLQRLDMALDRLWSLKPLMAFQFIAIFSQIPSFPADKYVQRIEKPTMMPMLKSVYYATVGISEVGSKTVQVSGNHHGL
jgi:hypothetical protein